MAHHRTVASFRLAVVPRLYRWYCQCGARGRAIYTRCLDAERAGARHEREAGRKERTA